MYNENVKKTFLFDFSRVLLLPLDKTYKEGLNNLYNELKESQNFNFHNYFILNTELISFLKTIKDLVPLYMYTSEHVQEDPAVNKIVSDLFIKIFSAKRIGFKKTDREGYIYIANIIHKNPQDIIFIDDNASNVQTATEAGLTAVLYTSNKNLISYLKKVI